MVTLRPEARWKVTVYGAEHGIPHFHIEGPGFRCSISIETNELIVGSAPKVILNAALKWAAMHQAELAAKWMELNP
jgi:Domain of unknown function (DUF4160)